MKKAFKKFAKQPVVTAEKKVEAALKNAQANGVLKLTDSSLTQFPSELSHLDQLKLVEKWWETTPLTKIDLSNNLITIIPEDINAHQELQHIQLFNNKIVDVTPMLFMLKHLKFIDLSINQIKSLPSSIGECEALVEIRINGNELSAIPEEIGHLSNLEIIDMSTNLISVIPNSLGSLKKIKKLNLKENKIAKVNKSISNLTMLADIDLSSNVIELIEKGAFSAMCSLVILNLCQNKLVEFSEIPTSQKLDSLLLANNRIAKIQNLKNAPNLTVLDISTNKIEVFPEAVLDLKKIKTLNIQNNSISDIPPQLCLLDDLVRIALDGNPLKALKPTMRTAGAAELKKYLRNKLQVSGEESKESISLGDRIIGNKLNLKGTGIKEIPQQAFEHSNLADIDASKNQISVIPNDISKFNKLGALCVSDNRLVDLPNTICNIASLKVLQASSNKLKYLFLGVHPSKLMAMNLQIIDLNGNDLGKVPSCLKYFSKLDTLMLANNNINSINKLARHEFSNLSVLDVCSNKITTIPYSFALHLNKIQQFGLSNNNITKLPGNLFKCDNLKTLSLEGNAIKSIRYDIIAKGTGAILDFLKKMYNPVNDETEEIEKDSDEETPMVEEKKQIILPDEKLKAQINGLLVKENSLEGEIQKLSEKLKLAHDPGEKSDIRKLITAKSKECTECEQLRKKVTSGL